MTIPTPIIDTERCILTLLTPEQAPLLLEYYDVNRQHLAPWEPLREPAFYTLEDTERRIRTALDLHAAGQAIHFAVLDTGASHVIGCVNFTNILRGVFQACTLGYSLAARQQHKGLMHEALQAGIAHMFGTVGLRRIMANYIEGNTRSAAVLDRLGFQREGLAKEYLCIAGRWQDHVLTSLINRRDYHHLT
jgi:ribosomal-protein-alanine N-acetyltransferase